MGFVGGLITGLVIGFTVGAMGVAAIVAADRIGDIRRGRDGYEPHGQ